MQVYKTMYTNKGLKLQNYMSSQLYDLGTILNIIFVNNNATKQ